jgi:hypothetical protein
MLPTEANITTVAGDTAEFVSLGSGNWKCLWYQRYTGASLSVPVGSVVQVVNTITGAVATGTTTMPNDDTIPQNTEGDEYMTLAITPKATANKLKITVVWNGINSAGVANMIVALFQDSTADAIAAIKQTAGGGNTMINATFVHYMAAGTTSSTTFKVRAGCASAGTTTFNGEASARLFGGKTASSITIEEIKV